MPLLSTLTAAFSSSTDLTSKFTASYGTNSVSGGLLLSRCDNTYNHAVVTANSYQFDSVLWQPFPPETNGATSECSMVTAFEHPTTDGTRMSVVIDRRDNSVRFHSETDYWDDSADASQIQWTSLPDQVWFKMELSGGQFIWSTSPTGYDGWEVRRAITAPSWVTSVTTGAFSAISCHRNNGTANNGAVDNINLAPSPPAPVVPVPDPAPIWGTGPRIYTSSVVPLGVRIASARGTRMITGSKELVIRDTAPGGHASSTVTMSHPLDIDPAELGTFADYEVVDLRSTEEIWGGRLEDQGRGVGSDGAVRELAAAGAAAHASDRSVPMMFISTETSPFERFGGSRVGGEVSAGQTAAGADGVKVQAGGSTNWAASDYIAARDQRLSLAGWTLARYSCSVICGANTGQWLVRTITYPSATIVTDVAMSTSTQNFTGLIGGWDYPDTDSVLQLRLEKLAAGAVSEMANAHFYNIVQRGALVHEWGDPLDPSDYATDYLYAHDVVADLIGRTLTDYDGDSAFIDTSGSHRIDQLAYPGGATAAQVFADLAELQPTHLWEALGRNSSGKYRFLYRKWPTTVRYEADTVDGYSAPSSAGEIYDRVAVKWRDQTGRQRITRVFSAVAELTAVGLSREATIDLGEKAGSSSNATRAGVQYLQEHATPPNAGRITIARPILDLQTGRRVQPWEIRPGYLMRVRGVTSRPDSINPGGRNGTSVMRIVSREYRASTNTAECELDSYSLSVARELADLGAKLAR